MTAFGARLLSSRAPRVVLVAALFLLPFTNLASAALLVLVAQHRGWQVAGTDGVLAGALVGTAMAALGVPLGLLVASAGVTWAMAVLLGDLSRRGGFILPLQVAVLVCWVGVAVFCGATPDPDAFWTVALRAFATRLAGLGFAGLQVDALLPLAGIMTGLMAASALVSGLVALVAGTWLGGSVAGQRVGELFAQLRLGRVVGWLGLGTLLLGLARATPWADDLAVVTATAFALQGLAVVHWRAAAAGWPAAWPWAVYLPLVLLPALAVFEMIALGVLGLADFAFGFRARPRGVV
jgi:hypothetical protein